MTMTSLRDHIQSIRPGMTPAEIEHVKSEMLELLDRVQGGEELHLRLSHRESEVMAMMLEGRRLKEIAANLEISVKTVTTHRTRLLKKLRVENNLDLYRYGIRNGLISV